VVPRALAELVAIAGKDPAIPASVIARRRSAASTRWSSGARSRRRAGERRLVNEADLREELVAFRWIGVERRP